MFRALRPIPRLLLLPGVALMLFAATVLKYSSRECSPGELAKEALPLRSRACKDHLYGALKLPPRSPINCSRVVRGDAAEVQAALLRRLQAAGKRAPLGPRDYLNLTADCALFKAQRRFVEFPLSREEAEFPIAYSMVVHHKVELFERLLRALYAPQNLYCVHVDRKSPEDFQAAVRRIAACFPNVFVAGRLERVVYASWSRVQADLNCMEELLRRPVRWRYLLNTCGADFPLKTNAETVRALAALRGRNSLESEVPSAIKAARWRHSHDVRGGAVVRSDREKAPPPHGGPLFTGSAYAVLTRGFVEALFQSPAARQLLEWSKDVYSPDEHVWATLHRTPGMPGSVPANDKYQASDLTALARLVKWSYLEGDVGKGAPYPPCTGAHQRAVCVFGVGDLHWLLQQHHLLANKFDPEVDDEAIQCLEEYLRYKALYGEEP